MEQGLARVNLHMHHFTHQNIVIAHRYDPVDGAFDGGQRARYQGPPGDAGVPRHTVETVVTLEREAFRQGPLAFRQNVDSKVGCGAEVGDGGDLVAQADEDQRRVQRHRSKAAHCEPVRRAFGVQHARHRDTGRETSAGPPNEVVNRTGITKTKAEMAVETVFESMKKALEQGDRIELRGFGVFNVKPRKTGIGRNPRTGAEVSIPPGKAVRFKPGKELQTLQ